MQTLANVKSRFEALPLTTGLPALLAINTFALLVLDATQTIPGWIKTAASLFLLF